MAKHYHPERVSHQYQSRNKANASHEADNLHVLLNRTSLGGHIISSTSGSPNTSPRRPPFKTSALGGASGSSRSHGAPIKRNDSNLHPSFVHLEPHDQHFSSHRGESSSSFLAISPSNSRHPFASGEIEECDKYNPLILHHAEIQSIPQHRDAPVRLDKAYPSSKHYDKPEDHTHRGATYSQEARPHRHNLLYKHGVLTPKATSAVSTTMSIALAHTIISPSASSHATSTSLSSAFSKDPTTCKDINLETDSPRNPCNRRMSLPEPPPIDRNPARRMSCAVTSPPKFLDTIVQRVWNSQQTLPLAHPSRLALTDEDVETSGISDSQLLSYPTKQDLNQERGVTSSGSNHPNTYPASTSFTGSGSPCCSGPRPGGDWVEGQPFRRFSGRFIRQVTFSLDETHKSGLKAILALRGLTNGLTSGKITPISKINGRRFTSPSIPIPKISHRYPEQSSVVIINGQTRVLNKKTIPRVVIDWSDGVRDEFDPTGMSLDDILARCYCSSA